MKILLEIRDERADFFLELVKNFPFVKIRTLTPAKAELIEEIQEAVDTINSIKQGRAKPRPVSDFLNEL